MPKFIDLKKLEEELERDAKHQFRMGWIWLFSGLVLGFLMECLVKVLEMACRIVGCQ